MTPKTVGRFTYDPETQTVSGPAQYMRDQGNAKLAAICAGRDEAFNLSAGYSPDVVTAILVALQTDFAGWLGYQQLFGSWRREEAR